MNNGKQYRYKKWLKMVKQWAARHKITTESAISILFDDSPYNPDGGKDLVIAKDLYWAESNDFVGHYLACSKMELTT